MGKENSSVHVATQMNIHKYTYTLLYQGDLIKSVETQLKSKSDMFILLYSLSVNCVKKCMSEYTFAHRRQTIS